MFAVDEQDAEPVDLDRWTALAEGTLRGEGITTPVELSLLFVDVDAIAALNERFMGEPGPTDVLAFPIDEVDLDGRKPHAGGPNRSPDWPIDGPVLLGDVVVCPEVARRNAPDHAGTYDDEVALLIVHGILHVLGMDHAEDDERVAMQSREQAHLEKLHRT